MWPSPFLTEQETCKHCTPILSTLQAGVAKHAVFFLQASRRLLKPENFWRASGVIAVSRQPGWRRTALCTGGQDCW